MVMGDNDGIFCAFRASMGYVTCILCSYALPCMRGRGRYTNVLSLTIY